MRSRCDSYRRLSGVRNWLDRLRFDIERAEIVVFIGFSAADFHLSQVFFNASGLREKAFFINRPSSSPDPDERENQEGFGQPLYVGRDGFAQIVTETLRQDAPLEPRLASFKRYYPPQASLSVPPVEDIENLFIWGNVVREHVKRDHDLSKSDYHVLRNGVQEIQNHLSGEGRIALLQGDICDGKSLVMLGVMNGLVGGRPVFELRHPYADLLDETSSILAAYPNAMFGVENCFGLREDRLLGLARLISASAGGLILSARTISTEAESGKLKDLRSIPSLLVMEIGRLQSSEIDALVALIDQIAGWRDFRTLSSNDRRHFVEKECNGVISSVLLRLLNSQHVRNRYREEYNKISYLNERDRQMIIASLLVANIGFDAPLSFISDVFEQDFASVLNHMAAQSSGLKLVRAHGGMVKTIPSIGARNLLKNVIDTREIVNTTIYLLEEMGGWRRKNDFEQHIFSQFMRYSILSSIVSDNDEINRFFDHISKITYFRRMPLFWLQWHMAMSAQSRWIKAEEYLTMGYKAADEFERGQIRKYNRKQLDDRKAKFLAARAGNTMRAEAELFRDMKEALDFVGRLMREPELTHHPYETLVGIVGVLQSKGNTIPDDLR